MLYFRGLLLPTMATAAWLSLSSLSTDHDSRALRSLTTSSTALVSGVEGGAHKDTPETFGPNSCATVSRSSKGTCVISTSCGDNNVSAVEFAFVCYNPGSSVPHALHSFGMGGFEAVETFDSSVKCQRCSTVQNAFTGFDQSSMNMNSLPMGRTPSGDMGTLKEMTPQEAAFYGPKACISAFKSPAGTCIVQTRCGNTDISMFDVGITCLDKSGDYTRYLFGKGNFEKEETFDTRIECEVCLGVGSESGDQQIHGVLPKQLVEDVNTLKDEVLALKLEVRALQNGAPNSKAPEESARGELAAAVKAPVKTNAEKGLDVNGNPLAPAPARVAAPADKLEEHEVKAFDGNVAAPKKPEPAPSPAVGAPSPAKAPVPAPASTGGHHSLASITGGHHELPMIPAADVDEVFEEEPVIIHHKHPTPSPLQELLRSLAN